MNGNRRNDLYRRILIKIIDLRADDRMKYIDDPIIIFLCRSDQTLIINKAVIYKIKIGRNKQKLLLQGTICSMVAAVICITGKSGIKKTGGRGSW